MREPTQRLGSNPNEAIIRHAELSKEWEHLEARWPELAEVIHPGLPADIRDIADLSKPVWIQPEWFKAAEEVAMNQLVGKVAMDFETSVTTIDQHKQFLRMFTAMETNWLQFAPPDIRERVLQVLQPSANEALGLAANARHVTIREAADEFLEYKRGKIGSKVRGRRSGGGIKAATFRQCEWSLEGALKLVDPTDDLQTLTHEKLETVIDAAYKTAPSASTARNWMKHGLKQLLDWAHKRRDIHFRKSDETDELFALSKIVSNRIVSYNPETAAKLKLLKAVAEESCEGRGQPLWPFVLLCLNTGAFSPSAAMLATICLNFGFPRVRPFITLMRSIGSHRILGSCSIFMMAPRSWHAPQGRQIG